jgi:signal transduction histidine kinase
MFNQFNSTPAEQKLAILSSELTTPIDIIRGLAFTIKTDIESNKIDRDDLLKRVNQIAEMADKIQQLRDEIART